MTVLSPFRWAILGTGSVARKFVLDLAVLGDRVCIKTIASRQPENAQRFADSLGISHASADFETAIAADVDAVYIATPPAQHEAHALAAIAAGKAVLIEKPIAMDADAARRIAQAAQTAGVFCMEAMWTRFQPIMALVQAHIMAGDIGELRGFAGDFQSASTPDPNASLFDPDRGGGALMHRGVYPLSLARLLLGPIADMQSTARIGTTGVDEDCALALRHTNGALTTLRASLRANGSNSASIFGTTGTIRLTGPIWRPTGAVLEPTWPSGHTKPGPRRFEAFRESTWGQRIATTRSALRQITRQGQTRIRAPFAGNGYHYEALAMMDAVQAGALEAPQMPLAQSIELMSLIDQAKADWAKETSS